jgi:hypothetical protein
LQGQTDLCKDSRRNGSYLRDPVLFPSLVQAPSVAYIPVKTAHARRLLFCTFFLCLAVLTGTGCGVLNRQPERAEAVTLLPGQRDAVFSPAHESVGAAVSEFFGVQPRPVQPLEFPHDIHIQNGLTCTQTCHASVTEGPEAGIPTAFTCLGCHSFIATEAPRIQQLTAMYNDGIDLEWQRVYGFPQSAHVRFNHAPHIRAEVECATCHGDIASQTVAQYTVDHTMGFCVNCHTENDAPIDCMTCHF